MSDFTTRARETAEREAEKAAPDRPIKVIGDYQENIFREIARDGFKAGFTTAVSRLPSEEEIAEALVRGYESDAARLQGVNKHDLRAARAVRELIEKKMLN